MSYPAISLATATVGRHRCPQKRLQTARQPPVYPNSSPDHPACNSLTPFRCPHAVHPCPSVDSGLERAKVQSLETFGMSNRENMYWLMKLSNAQVAPFPDLVLDTELRPFLYAIPLKGLSSTRARSLVIGDSGIVSHECDTTFAPLLKQLESTKSHEVWQDTNPKVWGVVFRPQHGGGRRNRPDSCSVYCRPGEFCLPHRHKPLRNPIRNGAAIVGRRSWNNVSLTSSLDSHTRGKDT